MALPSNRFGFLFWLNSPSTTKAFSPLAVPSPTTTSSPVWFGPVCRLTSDQAGADSGHSLLQVHCVIGWLSQLMLYLRGVLDLPSSPPKGTHPVEDDSVPA